MKVLDIVKDDAQAYLSHAQDGGLHYYVDWSGGRFWFVVPFEDVAGGRFKYAERAMTLMRWIRKSLDLYKEGNDF